MIPAINIMTEQEVQRCIPDGDEPGFGGLSTSRGYLPLKAMDVHTRITGFLAHTTLRQTFVNNTGESLEATYIFPLPDRAAVQGFRLEVAGRVIEGMLKERGQARREYDRAIATGHRAAITEEERPGVFSMRTGNIQPGEAAVVQLIMVGPLPYSGGEATFRFPLVVAPRYIPGRPLGGEDVGDGVASDTDAVPDASRISPPVLLPGYPNPVRLDFVVDVDPAGLPLKDIRSSLHAAVVDHGHPSIHRFRLTPGERLNRDVIIRLVFGDHAVGTSLLLSPDAQGKGGTFALTLVPPLDHGKGLKPRDVVFVLDRSGSMEGWKMVAARRAVARMVDTLRDADRFNVYAFDDTVETPPSFKRSSLLPATDRNRFRAVEFLAKVESRGGTEMYAPLDQATRQLAKGQGERDCVLVLITDGQVGNENQIVQVVGRNIGTTRIFALGIDQAVNAAFLNRLAGLGGGDCELVESEDRLDEVMDRTHRKIDTPVISGLSVEPRGLDVVRESLTPARMPDLFAGAPVVVLGRYRGSAEGSLTLKARDQHGTPWSAHVVGQCCTEEGLSAIWARGHIRDLEDRLDIGNANRASLEKEILSTSLQFNVMCRFTSFVAVDRAQIVNPGGHQHKVVQPVEQPAGWQSQRPAIPMSPARMAAPACPASMSMDALGDLEFEANDVEECCEEPCALSKPTLSRSFATRDRVAGPVAPASPRAKAPAGGVGRLLGAVVAAGKSLLGGKVAQAPSVHQTVTTLEGGRTRAWELHELLERDETQGSLSQRLLALGALRPLLEMLVDELRRIQAPAETLQPLVLLLDELRNLQQSATPASQDQVDLVWELALETLEDFSLGSAPATGRRAEFWRG